MLRCPVCGSTRIMIQVGRRGSCQACGATWRHDGRGRLVLDSLAGSIPAFQAPDGAARELSPEAEERNVSIPVPEGVSAFELGFLVIDCLVKDHGASVLDYDVTGDRSVVKLRVRAPTRTFDSLLQTVADAKARARELHMRARALQEEMAQQSQKLLRLRDQLLAGQAVLWQRWHEARELTA